MLYPDSCIIKEGNTVLMLRSDCDVDYVIKCVVNLQNLVWALYLRSDLQQNQFHQHLQHPGFDFCSIPAIHELCEMFNRSWAQIRPAFDADGDWFSIVSVCTHVVT